MQRCDYGPVVTSGHEMIPLAKNKQARKPVEVIQHIEGTQNVRSTL